MGRRDLGDDLAGSATLVVVMAAIAVAVMAAALFIAICTELAKVYIEHGFRPTRTAKILWAALVCLGVICGAAILLSATSTNLVAPAAYAAAWGLLVYSIVVCGCNLYEQRSLRVEESILDHLDTYLTPFASSPTAPSQNGRPTKVASLY